MTEVKWIKITTNMFDDEKIRLIESMKEGDSILIVWIKLLVQAGKTNANGFIYLKENMPYTDEMLATIFGRPLNIVRLALRTLESFGMISVEDKGILVTNWDKHQNIDGLEKIREQRRLRQEKFRAKQKALAEGKTGNVTITLSNGTELDLDLDLDKEKDQDQKSSSSATTTTTITDNGKTEITDKEKELLHLLKTVPGYKFNGEHDLDTVRSLLMDFPDVDITEQLKLWREAKKDDPLKANSSPRKQLRNWMTRARTFNGDSRKLGGQGGPKGNGEYQQFGGDGGEKGKSKYESGKHAGFFE